ncbi:hypothetical protein NLI96_g4055 [Meripilus lineatus]|uniref:NADH:flavin oxidoreductase/NADH oxidase N-terminal domain-containing protein n=1 Tax=Meripilus lineatus TaxID=2056292 RepID=A0AAD5V787_9APHY|nr:hypothetical protein NLI96_g4055 [Physisporinus lineatus]
MSPSSKLFQPIQVGDIHLKHRVVLAPLTRFRNTPNHVPTDLSVEYYSQRASTPGTLLITEATVVGEKAGGFDHVPHLETEEQIVAWRKVTEAVHEKGSYIYAQLWAFGRSASPGYMAQRGLDYVGASDIPLSKQPKTRPLRCEEVKEYVQLFARAAVDAVEKAGFDGVEIHGANGYLVDQFIQDVSNNRADEYGGSIENRCRFPLEILDAVSKALGTQQKVAIRLSPWETIQGTIGARIFVTLKQIAQTYPGLSYLHVTEPRVAGSQDRDIQEGESNDFLRQIWSPRPFITAGGYDRTLAIDVAERTDNLVAFGRHFLSNPDLPLRLLAGLPLNKYDRSTFYKVNSPVGYTDYPFSRDLYEALDEKDGKVVHASL